MGVITRIKKIFSRGPDPKRPSEADFYARHPAGFAVKYRDGVKYGCDIWKSDEE